jgi:hypothetical protein
MASTVYDIKNVYTVDDFEIEISPLKIKYLREFMETFQSVKNTNTDEEATDILTECIRICMKQFYPEWSKNKKDVEDNFDMPTIFEILDVAAGIKISKKSKEPTAKDIIEDKSVWADLDLVKLESEAFLLGIWKDYNELETSISMPELMAILQSKREVDNEERKFLAAIQGIDLDKNKPKEEDAWTKLKNKVFNGGRQDTDILTYTGDKAKRAGFGIGMGLDYENLN